MPEHLRSTVYAFDRCFEGALGATAAPLVGLVAERAFGFSGNLGQSVDEARSLSNAHALGNAMLVLLLLPWGFDFFVYFGETLHTLTPVSRHLMGMLPMLRAFLVGRADVCCVYISGRTPACAQPDLF